MTENFWMAFSVLLKLRLPQDGGRNKHCTKVRARSVPFVASQRITDFLWSKNPISGE